MNENVEDMYEDMSYEVEDEDEEFRPISDLEAYVVSATSLMTSTSAKAEWIDRTVHELRHLLLEAGVCCIELKVALEKVKTDLEQNLQRARMNESMKIDELSVKERYSILQPPYMEQLFDESINQELIEVWIEGYLNGDMALPGKLPNILGQMVYHQDPEWAESALEPSQPWGDMRVNPTLRSEVFKRVGLI